MAKVSPARSASPDDPIYSTGTEIFSVRRLGGATESKPSDSVGAGLAPSTSTGKLPPTPEPKDFKTDAEYQEALGFWQSRVGRLKGMRGVQATGTIPSVAAGATPAGSSSAMELPPVPLPKDFKTSDEYEEALGSWQSRVISVLGMQDVSQMGAPDDSHET